MPLEPRRDLDQLLRATFGRLISSVLAHGRFPAGEQAEDAASESSSALASDSTVTLAAPTATLGLQPGALVAQRYRIVHLLGHGGMGEVYRADDLVLGQAVALKFLPTAPSNSALSRFRSEVRLARQISHPNVCRVYDIGDAEGLTYLSMEYVDGEDLASLLRRIGKLPHDKALEIARQLCAGLAAAHDKGIIHRDLKPANIMLDGKGHVRITDFGLAGVAERVRDVRSGTPAYMSPEQAAGKGVTLRSDIYALGIVLHELLTGKRPSLEPGNGELDPEIAPVIQRCLEPNPHKRPASPLQVSAALPGGDPLAAALARGETPAPELVANAGPVEGLRRSVAISCLAVVMVGLGLLCILRQRHDLINQIPLENSPEVQAAKARDVTKEFGYAERPVDTFFAWQYDTDYFRYASERKTASARDSRFYVPYPPAVFFWYRQSPHYPINSDTAYEQFSFNRDTLEPGMQAVVLDSEGRLLEFQARPLAVVRTIRTGIFDWSRLFAAAGLDPVGFKTTEPELTPTSPFDTQAAWAGSAEGVQDLRVEATAYQGRPVSFRVLGPWARLSELPPVSFGSIPTPAFVFGVLALPSAAGLLAWRNLRIGRGDRRGAFRLAGFLFLLSLLDNLAVTHHVPTATEFALLFAALRYALAFACVGWVLYIAFEPQLRRRAPESLTSWSRLLVGRPRDPMVGGHLLAGVALGVLTFLIADVLAPARLVPVSAPKLPFGNAGFLSLWCGEGITGVLVGLSVALALDLGTILVRRRWLRVPFFVVVTTLLVAPGYGTLSVGTLGRAAVVMLMIAITLTRFGVLATVASVYTGFIIQDFPLTTNWSTWYAQASLLALATIVALAVYGLLTTLRSRLFSQARPRGLSANVA
jgi:serine/threonine-protein kinase